jgi:hypothetical protein
VPSKFPRAGRIVSEETTTEDDDAPSRSFAWESSTAATIPGVTRLSTTLVRALPSYAGTLAEGTNPPRDPSKRSTTRDETAPLD